MKDEESKEEYEKRYEWLNSKSVEDYIENEWVECKKLGYQWERYLYR